MAGLGALLDLGGVAGEHQHDVANSVLDTAGKIAGTETRQDRILDDDLGQGVGEDRLKPAADLDADLVIVGGDNEKDAVVQLLGADAPMATELIAELLDAVALQRRQRDHYELIGALVLEQLEIGDQLFLGVGAEQLRVIDDAAGELRKGRLGGGRPEPKHQDQGRHHNAEAPHSGHLALALA